MSTDDRRRHLRVPLQTQVAVTHFDVVHQLEVANASRSGLFLEGDPTLLPEFSIGAEVTVRLFDEQLDEESDVVAMAKVVRVVRGKGPVVSGVALAFTEIDEDDEDRLDMLLERGGATEAPRICN